MVLVEGYYLCYFATINMKIEKFGKIRENVGYGPFLRIGHKCPSLGESRRPVSFHWGDTAAMEWKALVLSVASAFEDIFDAEPPSPSNLFNWSLRSGRENL